MGIMKQLRVVLDIDGTICNNTNGKYDEAKPYVDMIALVNELYDTGHYIIFHTARGMGRGNSVPNKAATLYYRLTQNQLEAWGVKYHELHLGKILGDIYLDDRGFRLREDGSSVKDVKEFLKSNFNLEDEDA